MRKKIKTKIRPTKVVIKEAPVAKKTKLKKTKNKNDSLLGRIGGTLGTIFGGPVGGRLGSYVGQLAGKITGLGTYKVSRNTLLTDNGPPLFASKGGVTTVVHREFIKDIVGSTAFTITKYIINPGNATTFPWLSGVALNYEEYRFKGIIFEFKTTCAVAVGSTNTAMGTVVAATEYNVLNDAFNNKQQMEAYEFSTSTVPFNSMIHPVECKPSLTVLDTLFVDSGSVQNDSDLRFYDLGNFYIATVGMQAAATIGELWVSYHVELIKPRLQPQFAPSIGTAAYDASYNSTASAISTGAAFYTELVAGEQWNKNCIYYDSTNSKIGILGSGYYIVAMLAGVSGTATLTTAPQLNTITDGQLATEIFTYSGTTTGQVSVTDTATGYAISLAIVETTSAVNYTEMDFKCNVSGSTTGISTMFCIAGLPLSFANTSLSGKQQFLEMAGKFFEQNMIKPQAEPSKLPLIEMKGKSSWW